MIKQNFSNIIAENFQEICCNFKIGLKKKGYIYVEDLMNDAFISCCKALQDKEITKQEALRYYWTAYINKLKTHMIKYDLFDLCDEMEKYEDIEVEKYNDIPDQIYNIIITELQDNYGLKKAFIWEQYTCSGKTTKEIVGMGITNVPNMMYFSKQVKRYIKNHIIPNNKVLQELIKYRKDN